MWEAINHKEKLRLIIKKDKSVGYYLIVFPLNSDKSVADHLLDTLEDAFEEAKERYSIDKKLFKQKAP